MCKYIDKGEKVKPYKKKIIIIHVTDNNCIKSVLIKEEVYTSVCVSEIWILGIVIPFNNVSASIDDD